jgi:hypothetical protein
MIYLKQLAGRIHMSLRALSTTPFKFKQMELLRSPGRLQDLIARCFALLRLHTETRGDRDWPPRVCRVFNNLDIVHLTTIYPAIKVVKLYLQAKRPPHLAPLSVVLVRYPDDLIYSRASLGSPPDANACAPSSSR